MCLGVPGRVIETRAEGLDRVGRVDFGGVVREISLAYVPEAGVDSWVIVHAGLAISVLDEEDARETLRYLREMAETLDS